ncbi:hypothetical protein [Pectobacterium versatile]|uniref:hypothetical protein n=1 Tax=Pectobacterium versatile TaxID=2488639 RepID=UPI001B397743|nr:hypothetical protein [Pectobacterium versatile]MBQ4777532.1 hypothetical protein [Pectobacterium versatile]UCP82230.1 hypothetical protein LGL95_02660 [Pectobacterium versatile]
MKLLELAKKPLIPDNPSPVERIKIIFADSDFVMLSVSACAGKVIAAEIISEGRESNSSRNNKRRQRK